MAFALAYIRSLIGLLLVVAAAAKAADRYELTMIVRNFELVPARAARWIARCLPETEAMIGGALVLGLLTRGAAFAAAGLFVVFAGAIATNLLRGRTNIACGCFGANSNAPLAWMQVWRNLAFAGGAVVVATAAAEPPVMALPAADAAAAALIAAVSLACWWLGGLTLRTLRKAAFEAESMRETTI